MRHIFFPLKSVKRKHHNKRNHHNPICTQHSQHSAVLFSLDNDPERLLGALHSIEGIWSLFFDHRHIYGNLIPLLCWVCYLKNRKESEKNKHHLIHTIFLLNPEQLAHIQWLLSFCTESIMLMQSTLKLMYISWHPLICIYRYSNHH